MVCILYQLQDHYDWTTSSIVLSSSTRTANNAAGRGSATRAAHQPRAPRRMLDEMSTGGDGTVSDGDESDAEGFQNVEEQETIIPPLSKTPQPGIDPAPYNICWSEDFQSDIPLDGRGMRVREKQPPKMAGVDAPSD